MLTNRFVSLIASFILLVSLAFCSAAKAGVIVEFNTNVGNFQVELFSLQKPASVANFLTYVDSGTYSNSIVHRSIQNTQFTGFGIIQGGGYDTAGSTLTTQAPIADDVGIFSNVRGTIAYANAGPNTATRQWYINVSDNLVFDTNYTVFGQVIGNGMTVVDQISAFTTLNANGNNPNAPFGSLPVINASLPNNLVLQPSNLVVVNSITAVPEPRSILMLLTGLVIVGWRFRRS